MAYCGEPLYTQPTERCTVCTGCCAATPLASRSTTMRVWRTGRAGTGRPARSVQERRSLPRVSQGHMRQGRRVPFLARAAGLLRARVQAEAACVRRKAERLRGPAGGACRRHRVWAGVARRRHSRTEHRRALQAVVCVALHDPHAARWRSQALRRAHCSTGASARCGKPTCK